MFIPYSSRPEDTNIRRRHCHRHQSRSAASAAAALQQRHTPRIRFTTKVHDAPSGPVELVPTRCQHQYPRRLWSAVPDDRRYCRVFTYYIYRRRLLFRFFAYNTCIHHHRVHNQQMTRRVVPVETKRDEHAAWIEDNDNENSNQVSSYLTPRIPPSPAIWTGLPQ